MKKILMAFVLMFAVNSLHAVAFGDKAINFTGTTIDGKEISLEQYKGKKAVWLTFWATWCPYCEKEIIELKKLHEKYGDKLEIIAVNIGVRDSLDNIEAYQMKHDLPYSLIMSNEVTRMYGIRSTPSQVVIDIKGRVIYAGARVPSDIDDKTINSLLQ